MTVYPNYYKDFKCTADKCKHNCCIGWEIDIDENTYKKYKELGIDHIEETKGSPHFVLTKDERCPYLLSSGLCELIQKYGEESLCQICTDHPRFRNFLDDRTEVGLGLSCEEAARIILLSEEKFEIENNGLPPVSFRDEIITILQNRNVSICHRISKVLEYIEEEQIKYSPLELYDLFSSLEVLDPSWTKELEGLKNINGIEIDLSEFEIPFEQLLCYLVFRNVTPAVDDGLFEERVMLVVTSFYLIKDLLIARRVKYNNFTNNDFLDICRMFSAEVEYSDISIYELLEHFRKDMQ